MRSNVDTPLLQVEDLTVAFPVRGEIVPAVDGVSLDLYPCETLALIGESGCGKTVTGLSLLGLTPAPGQVVRGQVRLDGKDLISGGGAAWREVRGKRIGMIFQDPLTSLDPVYNAGSQIAEGLRFHYPMSRRDAWKRSVQALEDVGIVDPEARARLYPHQLSGGMRQRVMIAAAIACKPQILIADEPTTALDVTVQAQIIDLLEQLQRDRQMSILLITHDLGVVARMAHRVAVMYAGQIVEYGDARTVLDNPAHPYTAGLIAAVPRAEATTSRLPSIDGTVPAPGQYPDGCRFRPRCSRAGPGCELPQALRTVSGGRTARCLYPIQALPTCQPGRENLT